MIYELNGIKISGAFKAMQRGQMVSFPSNWLELATPSELAEIGVTVSPDPVIPPYVPTLAEVKESKLNQLNQAYNEAMRVQVAYTPATAQPAWKALVEARDYAAFMRLGARTASVTAAPNVDAVEAIVW